MCPDLDSVDIDTNSLQIGQDCVMVFSSYFLFHSLSGFMDSMNTVT